MAVPFVTPTTMCVSGGTGSGKTTWVRRMLKDNMFNTDQIMYCYGVHQPVYDDMKSEINGIKFAEGLPFEEIQAFSDLPGHKVIVLDDLMSRVVAHPEAELLFTQGSHHKNLTVVFITQNLFSQGRCARTIALNTHFLVLFRNFRDKAQVMHLGRQLYPQKVDGFMEAYNDATQNRYGYLVIDLCPHTSDERTRLRTKVFKDELTTCYEPVNKRKKHF